MISGMILIIRRRTLMTVLWFGGERDGNGEVKQQKGNK